jgi:hypothetical protein
MKELAPLTDLQRETLRCAAEGRLRHTQGRIKGWQYVSMWLAYGRVATCQVKALNKRGLVRAMPSFNECRLTLAGAFELYFEPGRLL